MTNIRSTLEAAAAKANRLPPATESQIAYLADLMEKAFPKGGNATSNVEHTLKDIASDSFGLTKRAASNYIDEFKFWAN